MFYEQQRLDRDDYITLVCENIIESPPGTQANCSDAHCVGYGCAFQKLDAVYHNASGPYDTQSIMHYGKYLGMHLRAQDTLTAST